MSHNRKYTISMSLRSQYLTTKLTAATVHIYLYRNFVKGFFNPFRPSYVTIFNIKT